MKRVSLLVIAFILIFTGCEFFPGSASSDTNLEPLEEISVTFDEKLDSKMWSATGYSSKIIDGDTWLAQFAQYGDALTDTHGKIYQLDTYESRDAGKYGESFLKIKKISVAETSALSFDYRCDLLEYDPEDYGHYANYFAVYIDDSSKAAFSVKGQSLVWKKATVQLSPGEHSVTFAAKFQDSVNPHCDTSLTNSVYLDNITLAPDKIASVDIYPKGLQETYVGGNTIQFSARALRSDGTEISDKKVIWNSTSGNVDSTGLFTPGSEAGLFSVTATIGDQSASNQTVKVHGENYVADPVTINGHTFTGAITEGRGKLENTENIIWASPTPEFNEFTTDGFFPLKGTTKNDTDLWISVCKMDEDNSTHAEWEPDYKYSTFFIIPAGDFSERIWLRYGDGTYWVWIYEGKLNGAENYDGYEGAVWGLNQYDKSATTLYVTNKTNLPYSADQCSYLMPSAMCQSDDYTVSNVFNALMAELPSNATTGDKLRALYDYELSHTYYDMVSVGDDMDNPDSTKRKKQDALHVLLYGMGVCDGYTNLYTALARLCGVPSAYQVSMEMNHGWSECYYKDKWLLVDVTWDDTTEPESVGGTYNYFLIEPSGIDHDHYQNETDYSRSVKNYFTALTPSHF